MKVIFRNSSLVFERAISVNLVAKYGVEPNLLINDRGEQITMDNYNTTNFAPVENYTKVLPVLLDGKSSVDLWINSYDNNKVHISHKQATFTSEPVAIPSTAKYIRVTYDRRQASEIRIQE